ncbi:hypothetical protein [Dactylosporangium sp. CA-139066]|uniref:hypothetical protein n=1 Tax=Dactylosporangium sp. CA-139066 TaxID=3239930 RepID=UPI003D932D6A
MALRAGGHPARLVGRFLPYLPPGRRAAAIAAALAAARQAATEPYGSAEPLALLAPHLDPAQLRAALATAAAPEAEWVGGDALAGLAPTCRPSCCRARWPRRTGCSTRRRGRGP